ncbi:MAG: type 1 glutamine amidotransferase domain-containing protein [Candidatus Dormibacteria bacterium]
MLDAFSVGGKLGKTRVAATCRLRRDSSAIMFSTGLRTALENRRLRMRIACLLDSDFEDSEFRQPYDALREAGHEVVIIGLEKGKQLPGKKGVEMTRAEAGVDDVSPDQFDALLVPGGYSPDHLRATPKMVAFTKAFFDDERPVFAVCHGPQLLLTAGVVKGRTMTAWTTVQQDLRYAGAHVKDEEVVVDGNLVTSRKPDDLEAFCRESIRMLERVPVGAR